MVRIDVCVGVDLEPRSVPRREPTDESAQIATPGRGPRRGRVLVMDDDPMVRQIMHRQLAICGFEVTVAERGEDAVAAYRRAREEGRPFAAVILDLLVPSGWGGEQTLAELLTVDPGVRALVCSGTLKGPKAHYRKQGFRGVLAKPYSLADLRAELEEVLLAPNDPGADPPGARGAGA